MQRGGEQCQEQRYATLDHQFVLFRSSSRHPEVGCFALVQSQLLQWCTEHGKLCTPLGPSMAPHHDGTPSVRRVWPSVSLWEQQDVHLNRRESKNLPSMDSRGWQEWTNYEIAREIIIINATEIPPDTLPSERFRGTGPLLPHRQRLLCIT